MKRYIPFLWTFLCLYALTLISQEIHPEDFSWTWEEFIQDVPHKLCKLKIFV